MPLTNEQFALNTSIAILLMGPPLTGKTNLAFQFPDPYVMDADDKLTNAVARQPGRKFWYDVPTRKMDPKLGMIPVAPEMQWEYVVECLKSAAAMPEVKTIVLDSVTTLSHILMQHILRFPSTAGKSLMVGGIKVMDQSMWGPYRELWTKLIMGLRATGKFVVVIAHTIADKDEVSGAVSYRPSFSGQLRDTAAGLFTDVWNCEPRQIPLQGGNVGTDYVIRTQPLGNMPLGNSLGLPNPFRFTWPEFEVYINRMKKAAAPTPPAPVIP